MTNGTHDGLYTEEEALRIRHENYEKTQAFNEWQQAMLAQAKAMHIPHKGTFELTPFCSMKCKMCYMRLDPDQAAKQGRLLTAEEWIRLGKMAFDAGTVDLLLTGGEPFLRKDFAEIYTALSDMGFLLRIFTNGTMFTDETMALMRDRPPQSMEITMYGASPETYAKVGGWADGYERAVRAIDSLREFLPSLKLKGTLIRESMDDYDAMKKFAAERALPMDFCLQPLPTVRGACSRALECRLGVQELLEFARAKNITPFNEGCEPVDPSQRSAVFCGAGLVTYTVQWNGDMVACNMDDDPNRIIGRPLEEGFDAAWNKLRNFANGKPLPEPCKTCDIYAQCGCCAVHHRQESGSYTVPARYVCDYHRIYEGLEPLPEEAFAGQKKT